MSFPLSGIPSVLALGLISSRPNVLYFTGLPLKAKGKPDEVFSLINTLLVPSGQGETVRKNIGLGPAGKTNVTGAPVAAFVLPATGVHTADDKLGVPSI
jgi:hypothetical protein